MKKKYYGILLAAVIAAGTIGVTAQAAELADTEKLTETANVTDDVNTANSTDASVQAQSDELEVPLVLNQTYTRSFSQVGQKYYFTGSSAIIRYYCYIPCTSTLLQATACHIFHTLYVLSFLICY